MEKKTRILVADDEQRNRIALTDLLVSQGYEVLQACDGMEALEKTKDLSPDVILLDIKMPKLNGLEVTKIVKKDENMRLIPIIMVTGLDDVRLRIQALKLGADDFLTKPPRMAELTARVRSLAKVKAYNDHMRNYQKELEAQVEKRTQQLKMSLQQRQQIHEKLKDAYRDTIHRLSRAAEYKDEDTGAHLLRLSNYVAMVSREMGLDEAAVESILYAVPMHDIGKIGVPDKILLKPGKLSPEEWQIMKKHTTFGAEILKNSSSDFLKVGRVIALSHHEKWDGTGYPKGLRGSKIPLPGRITAIADVFDALTSKRPYKEAIPIEKSFQIIREGKRKHFDPDIVDAFFRKEDQFVEFRNKYQDKNKSVLFKFSNSQL